MSSCKRVLGLCRTIFYILVWSGQFEAVYGLLKPFEFFKVGAVKADYRANVKPLTLAWAVSDCC